MCLSRGSAAASRELFSLKIGSVWLWHFWHVLFRPECACTHSIRSRVAWDLIWTHAHCVVSIGMQQQRRRRRRRRRRLPPRRRLAFIALTQDAVAPNAWNETASVWAELVCLHLQPVRYAAVTRRFSAPNAPWNYFILSSSYNFFFFKSLSLSSRSSSPRKGPIHTNGARQACLCDTATGAHEHGCGLHWFGLRRTFLPFVVQGSSQCSAVCCGDVWTICWSQVAETSTKKACEPSMYT